MPAYLGPLGGLVPIEGVVSPFRIGVERPASNRTTLGGVRKVQIGPRSHRRWDVTTSRASRPDELAAVQAFVEGEFGAGPWWWVDQWAQVTNVMSPRASVFDATTVNAVVGGPIVLSGGERAGRHLVVVDQAITVQVPRAGTDYEYLPVVPGVPVTGAVWLAGSAPRVRLRFFDAAGVTLLTTTGATVEAASTPVRAATTEVPPAGAVSVLMVVTGATRIARPSVTWTDKVMPYHVGQGAPKAIVTALEQGVSLAHPGTGGQLAGATFAVTEVG